MITSMDDYPIHQIAEPVVRTATSSRNAYDRYFFNGYEIDGGFYFGVALGLYPNRLVADASFSVRIGDRQHALHASRRRPDDPADTSAGPVTVDVVEPLRVLRVRVAANETGLECDLTFRARGPAVEEAHTTMRDGERIVLDLARLTQLGRWEGWLSVAGTRVEIRPERVLGTRDRSWGVRPVGEPEPGAPGSFAPLMWLWAPVHFADHGTMWGTFESADGRMWYADGRRVPHVDTADAARASAAGEHTPLYPVRHDLRFEPGSRYVSAATLAFETPEGKGRTLELTPILRFHLAGLGYGHPTWGHGVWHGERAIEGETWEPAGADPLAFHLQHCQHLCKARDDEGREGVGVLEQLIIGPHDRYGFTDLLDPAPHGD